VNEQARTDRIDFTILNDSTVLVTKMVRYKKQRRDIPHMNEQHAPGTFDLEAALQWCEMNGYTVQTWPKHENRTLGARAWKGNPWPIRTRYQIVLLRQELEDECMAYWDAAPERREHMPIPRWMNMTELAHVDLAYVG